MPSEPKQRVELAIARFSHRGGTWDDRRDAVRDLAGVLEYLREGAREVRTSKDEQDLFEIANRFGIRHDNPSQKTEYDRDIWFSWIFYYYLPTIHALTRLVERQEKPAA